MSDRLTRIAIVSADRCKPKKCRQECKKSCPVVKTGVDLYDRNFSHFSFFEILEFDSMLDVWFPFWILLIWVNVWLIKIGSNWILLVSLCLSYWRFKWFFFFVGKLCIEVSSTSKIAFLSEELCIGCGICVKVYTLLHGRQKLYFFPFCRSQHLTKLFLCVLEMPIWGNPNYQSSKRFGQRYNTPLWSKLFQVTQV